MIVPDERRSSNKALSRVSALAVLVLMLAAISCGTRTSLTKSPEETAPADSLLSQGFDVSVDSMLALEQTQLANKELQNIFVAGVWFQRFLGDMKFREIDSYDYDNLRDFPRNTVFDVVLDLRDSTRFGLAQVRAKSLTPTSQSGFYRCYLGREVLRMLSLNAISSYSAIVFERDRERDRERD